MLRISGQIGDQTHAVTCDDDDMTGSPQVTNWILMELGDQPYAVATIRALLPRLSRLFGTTMQVREEEETPAPEEGIPAPADAPLPENPVPDATPEPVEEPA